MAPIRVGSGSNIQDLSLLHVDRGNPCIVGNNVTIGHSAIVHGTVLEDDVTIAMGAVVLSRSHIGAGAVIAAGFGLPAVSLTGAAVAALGLAVTVWSRACAGPAPVHSGAAVQEVG